MKTGTSHGLKPVAFHRMVALLLGMLLSIPFQAAAQAAGNRPPIANAGPDRTLGVGALGLAGFTLDGTASFDPNSDPLFFQWYDANGTLVGSSSTVAQFRGAGSYVFTLVVNDGNTGTGSDSVVINIIIDTTPPLVLPPGDVTVSVSEAGGARASSSPQLAAFLAGAIAIDDFDDVPTSLPPTAGGVDVESNTLFPLNSTTGVTFFFTDDAGNIGRAVSNLTVVELKDGDLFVGANNVIPFAGSAGIIHHIRGTTVTTWCQSASGYYPADAWATPKELLVDSQGRVVFLAAVATDPGYGTPSWGLFRCSGPGLPIEHLAVYPGVPGVTFPAFPGASPSTLYANLSGLHLARHRSIAIDDNVNNGLPKIATEDAYVFSVETTSYPGGGLSVADPPVALRYRVAADIWEPGPQIVQGYFPHWNSYPRFLYHAHDPDLVFHDGATYSEAGSVIGRDKDPFKVKVTAHIGSITLGVDLSIFGGYKQVPRSNGPDSTFILLTDDLNVTNIPSGCPGPPPDGISDSVPRVNGGAVMLSGLSQIVYDEYADLGLVLSNLGYAALPPVLFNVSEALINDFPFDDDGDRFRMDNGICTIEDSLKYTTVTPGAPLASLGHVASAPQGIVGTDIYLGAVAGASLSGVVPIVTGLDHPGPIAAWPPPASPGFGATLIIQINSPVDVLLTDTNGKKLGVENGLPVNDFGSDGFDSGTDTHPRFYAINNPAPGSFVLNSVGTSDGPFTVHVYTADLDKPLGEHISHTGDATPGSIAKHDFTLAGDGALTFSNAPPAADAGPDQVVQATSSSGAPVALDASASSDGDGDALTFTWASPIGLLTGAGVNPTLPVGIHSLTLTVDDGKGGISSDTVEITVNPPANTERAHSNGSSSYFSEGGYNAYATFNVKFESGASTPSGPLTFSSSKSRRKIVSTGIVSLTVAGKTAVITGPSTLNGVAGYSFTATVGDNATPGAGADTFAITVTGPSGFTYTASGTIKSGDYTVSQ